MNILLTNDDGYGSWGIEALKKSLSREHNVYVMAPATNKSGAAIAITLEHRLLLTKKNDREYALEGSPADCVATALKTKVFDDVKFDAIITGINQGANIGTDIAYSGTCGAARQATLMGVPGIAVSMTLKDNNLEWDSRENWDFDQLADFVAKNVDTLVKMVNPALNGGHLPENPATYLNINSFSPYLGKGVKIVPPCYWPHDSKASIVDDSINMQEVYWTTGPHNKESREYSDFDACDEGYISLSVLNAEPCVAQFASELINEIEL